MDSAVLIALTVGEVWQTKGIAKSNAMNFLEFLSEKLLIYEKNYCYQQVVGPTDGVGQEGLVVMHWDF